MAASASRCPGTALSFPIQPYILPPVVSASVRCTEGDTPHESGDNSVMSAEALITCAWLVSSWAITGTSQPTAQRGILDVVVFYADAPRDVARYPLQVRQALQRFRQRVRAYRPRPRPARLGSEMRMVYAAREGYEAKLAASATAASAAALAQQYVDALGPCYEWER